VAFMQKIRSWIVLPSTVEFAWSADGVRWSPPVVQGHTVPVMQEAATVHHFMAELPEGATLRYLRVRARSAGPLPAEHPGAGQPSWLFADEIVVRRHLSPPSPSP